MRQGFYELMAACMLVAVHTHGMYSLMLLLLLRLLLLLLY